jgi:dienelactone hydrolase
MLTHPTRPSSRRNVLLAGAFGAAATTLAACTSDAAEGLGTPVDAKLATTPTTVPLSAAQAELGDGTFSLFTQSDLNFQTLFGLGFAGQIAVAGEVAAVVAQANAEGASYQTVYDGFLAMANKLQADAIASAKAGHLVTARSQYLRSARYFTSALYWVLGTSTPGAEAEVYSAMDASFRQAMALMDPVAEEIEIPYGDQPLPGWFLRPAGASGKRPTIIINNGSDGQLVDLLGEGGFAALERGYNVFIFEGPGQGSQLFLHNIPFTHEWEKVITPIVDVLERRDDVDAERIALRGISFGGALTPRAAAFEPRLAALVADPGSTGPWNDYPTFITDNSNGTQAEVDSFWDDAIIPGSTPEQLFALKKSLEIFSAEVHDEVKAGKPPTGWYTLSKEIQRYTLDEDTVAKITCPTLVTWYEDDAAFGDEPMKLYDMLRTDKKDLVKFTSVDGAQYHCGPMAPQISNEACWDWVDDVFRSKS